jgi:hypothetical protein
MLHVVDGWKSLAIDPVSEVLHDGPAELLSSLYKFGVCAAGDASSHHTRGF